MSIEYAQGWDDAKAQVTTDNSATLVNALVEIERLTKQVKHFHDLFHHNNEEKTAAIERKDAALRVALEALETAALNDPARNDDHYYDIAAGAVREALK